MIKVITNRDKELMAQLARTGVITQQQATQYLKYDNDGKRLANLAQSGYLREHLAKHGKEYVKCYKLDDLGKKYVKHNVEHIHRLYNGAGFSHDHKLTELYYEKYYEYRNTIRTEQDYKQTHEQGCPDFTVTIEGVTIAVEVITRSYTVERIEAKEIFAKGHGLEVQKYYV